MKTKGKPSGDTGRTSLPQGIIQAEGMEPGHILQSQRDNANMGFIMHRGQSREKLINLTSPSHKSKGNTKTDENWMYKEK